VWKIQIYIAALVIVQMKVCYNHGPWRLDRDTMVDQNFACNDNAEKKFSFVTTVL
jgi:hypothetical protein